MTNEKGCLGHWIRSIDGDDYDCEYETHLLCEECKYGGGRKDPEAKCNQSKEN